MRPPCCTVVRLQCSASPDCAQAQRFSAHIQICAANSIATVLNSPWAERAAMHAVMSPSEHTLHTVKFRPDISPFKIDKSRVHVLAQVHPAGYAWHHLWSICCFDLFTLICSH